MYFREYLCRFSRNWHHFCFFVVTHLKTYSHILVSEVLFNIGSGEGLLPDGPKPLPDPILTWCHQESPSVSSLTVMKYGFCIFKMAVTYLSGQWVKHGMSATLLSGKVILLVSVVHRRSNGDPEHDHPLMRGDPEIQNLKPVSTLNPIHLEIGPSVCCYPNS